MGCFGVNFGHPIVTNGDFVAYLCESDALFPNDFGGGDLLCVNIAVVDLEATIYK